MFHVRAVAFAIVMAAVAAVAAVAEDAPKPDLPAAPVNPVIQVSRGDSWTYDLRDDVTGDIKGTLAFEVTKVTDAEIETRVSQEKEATNGRTTSTTIFDARWRMKDNGKFVFRPYLDTTGIPQDLQMGKSWSFKYASLRKGAALTREFAGVGKVDGWEHVTLPSGLVYEAFKIDVTATATLAGNGRKLENHSIMWFAPAINRLVKRIDESRVNGKLEDATEQTLREYKPASKS
jgi:hypothetical protein